jgi:hypothetical protein
MNRHFRTAISETRYVNTIIQFESSFQNIPGARAGERPSAEAVPGAVCPRRRVAPTARESTVYRPPREASWNRRHAPRGDTALSAVGWEAGTLGSLPYCGLPHAPQIFKNRESGAPRMPPSPHSPSLI